MTLPIVLSIAGSDSGGGAGIQADLKTFQAFGCFGTTVVTAITAQNTTGVDAVHPVPADIVRAQFDAVISDLRPLAVKSGMVATRSLVEAIAEGIRDARLDNYVLDPVMVASSGDRLLDEDAEQSIATRLLPLSAVVTPNLDEASILTGMPVTAAAGMRTAAKKLVDMGARSALVKGGHLDGDELVDVFYDGSEFHEWRRPKRDTRNTHGTGCTLSAGIAAGLAKGAEVVEAIERALDYLQQAIEQGPAIGKGNRPVNHLIRGFDEG